MLVEVEAPVVTVPADTTLLVKVTPESVLVAVEGPVEIEAAPVIAAAVTSEQTQVARKR